MGNKLPQEQTVDEWLQEYDGAPEAPDKHRKSPVNELFHEKTETILLDVHKENQVVLSDISNVNTLSGNFLYVEHRTISKGRLILDFVNIETGKVAAMFFNVQVKSQRTGKKYPARTGGQFTCKGRTKFKQFWMTIFKKPPFRWCRAHHGLSKMKGMEFTGVAILKRKKDGTGSYWEIKELGVCK